MKVHCFIVLILKLFSVKGDSENKTIIYNVEEIVSKTFNFTSPITARQSNNGVIKFEDSSLFVDGNHNGLISFKEHSGQSFKFEDDQVDQHILQNYQDFGSESSQTFKFDDDQTNSIQNTINDGHIERPNQPLKFQDDQTSYLRPNPQNLGNAEEGYGLQDDNKIEEQKPLKRKRRRRRRKPRYQGVLQGDPGPHNIGPQGHSIPAYQGYPGNGIPQGLGPSGHLSGQYPYPYQYPVGPVGSFHRPQRRPKTSIASEALSAITGALSSIAQYDDYQCVPRLLCEAAGGGALGSSSVLQNIAGLQPLLTLLAAYNGISSSPLFIFGRAVFLGMTSKGNLGTCRYGYPQCPTDPEQLVHYLNNHNGGFFRFFNSQQLSNSQNGQQNLQQFYNQLSLPQNYGLYQPNTVQQNYGLYSPPTHQNYGSSDIQGPSQQGYGFQDPNLDNNNNIAPQNYGLNHLYQNNYQPGYGIQIPSTFGHVVGPQNYSPNYPYHYNHQQGYGFPNPNLYGNNIGSQNYGSRYSYQNKYEFHKNKFKNSDEDIEKNRIEKRIQNKPPTAYIDENFAYDDNLDKDHNSNWAFPGNNVKYNVHYVTVPESVNNNVRGGKDLKFPEEDTNKYIAHNVFNRKGKVILFPNDNQRYVNYYAPVPDNINNNFGFNYQNKDNVKTFTYQNNQNKIKQSYLNYQSAGNNNNYESNYNTHNQNNNMYNNNDGELETVYIVRGNGDPNNPEIVKVKPGQIIQ